MRTPSQEIKAIVALIRIDGEMSPKSDALISQLEKIARRVEFLEESVKRHAAELLEAQNTK